MSRKCKFHVAEKVDFSDAFSVGTLGCEGADEGAGKNSAKTEEAGLADAGIAEARATHLNHKLPQTP